MWKKSVFWGKFLWNHVKRKVFWILISLQFWRCLVRSRVSDIPGFETCWTFLQGAKTTIGQLCSLARVGCGFYDASPVLVRIGFPHDQPMVWEVYWCKEQMSHGGRSQQVQCSSCWLRMPVAIPCLYTENLTSAEICTGSCVIGDVGDVHTSLSHDSSVPIYVFLHGPIFRIRCCARSSKAYSISMY